MGITADEFRTRIGSLRKRIIEDGAAVNCIASIGNFIHDDHEDGFSVLLQADMKECTIIMNDDYIIIRGVANKCSVPLAFEDIEGVDVVDNRSNIFMAEEYNIKTNKLFSYKVNFFEKLLDRQ